jgi:tRNA(His) guanylyltransferase
MSDALGDRMKVYEKLMQTNFMPCLPIIVRLDGKGFSRYTKGFRRPYDERMSRAMVNTTIALVQESNAVIGYTQSDEITLVLYSDNPKVQVYFDGKIQKIVSVLASFSAVYFDRLIREEMTSGLPPVCFDARAFQVPSKEEAVNAVLWREQDATKNSISMAAREFYQHRELEYKNSSEMQDMLMHRGVNWNDYPAFFKRGTYVQRREFESMYTQAEIASLPPKHNARTNPEITFTRSKIISLELPPISKITNSVGVIFDKEEPEVTSGATKS